jgi:hypothetical protein
MAETGQFQIFFSFLGALIYQKSLLGSAWNIYVSAALIIVNIAVTGLFLYFACADLRDDIAEYTEERRNRKSGIWACICGGKSSCSGPPPLSDLTCESNSPNTQLDPSDTFLHSKEASTYAVQGLSKDEFPDAFSFPRQGLESRSTTDAAVQTVVL